MFQRLFLLTVLVTSLSTTGSSEDWYRWRGPNLDGISAESDWDHKKLADPNSLVWTTNVGVGFSSVVTSDGLLITSGNHDDIDTVHCLDAITGKPKWQYEYESPLDDREFEGGPTATPTIDGDRVYCAGRHGDLICLNKQNGEVNWKLNIVDDADVRIPGWGFSGSPLVIGDLLIVNAGDAGVAFDKNSGKIRWKSADKDSGYGSPVPTPDKNGVILPSGRSYVAVNLSDGRELWRQRWLTTFGCNASDPIVHKNHVFLCSGYNRGCALLDLNQSPPTVKWKHKGFQNQISTSVLIGGQLFGVHGDVQTGTALTCMDWDSGTIRWSSKQIAAAALTASSGRLIVISVDGELFVLSANGSRPEILMQKKVLSGKCWTSPVLSHSFIYCRNAAGDLVAYNLK